MVRNDDFGKVRLYLCICGVRPVRPLHGLPKPCDCCEEPLDGRPYTIEDHCLHVRKLLGQAREAKGGE